MRKHLFLFGPHVIGLLLPSDSTKFMPNQVVHNKMIFPLLPTVVVLSEIEVLLQWYVFLSGSTFGCWDAVLSWWLRDSVRSDSRANRWWRTRTILSYIECTGLKSFSMLNWRIWSQQTSCTIDSVINHEVSNLRLLRILLFYYRKWCHSFNFGYGLQSCWTLYHCSMSSYTVIHWIGSYSLLHTSQGIR